MTNPSMSEALAPVREALLARASEAAGAVVQESSTESEEVLARARAEADRILADARTAGEADASVVHAAERARSRRAARALILAAQSAGYVSLREASRDVLRRHPGSGVTEALHNRAVLTLNGHRGGNQANDHAAGNQARVVTHPDGGVVAQRPGVRVSCTVTGLVEHAMSVLGARLRGLWSP